MSRIPCKLPKPSCSRQPQRPPPPVVAPDEEQIPAASGLEKRIFSQALSKYAQQPGKVVRSIGTSKSRICPPKVQTKRGPEQVIQQMKIDQIVQRTPRGEYIAKTLTGVDVPASGKARQLQLTSQQIDPTHATESAGVNETISTTSSISITKGGKQMKQNFRKRTIIDDKTAKKPNMNPYHINRLVKEETADIENTLKIVPPDLVSSSVEKYPLRRKHQRLRLTAEPVSILQQNVVLPAPTADEMDPEAPPEVVASVIRAVEKGAAPTAVPNQLFNTLFPDPEAGSLEISSITPGPLQDIVVPTSLPQAMGNEMLTPEMTEFVNAAIQNQMELPKDDICSENKVAPAERKIKDDERIPEIIEGETAPWEDDTVRSIGPLVGGGPADLLDTTDVSQVADISKELEKGIEYYIEAQTAPYETKVQIRGSKLPRWFPGYMVALPHFPEIVRISRSPSQVLQSAWKAVQPKVFPEDSLLVS